VSSVNTTPSSTYLEQLIQAADQLEQDNLLHSQTGNLQLLDRSIEEGQALIQNAQWQSTPAPLQAKFMNTLGLLYYSCYQARGKIDDIDQSSRYFELALELVASTRRRRASLLSNLSAALQLRFTRLGEPQDIIEAIKTAALAVDLVSSDTSEKASYLINLSGAYYERYTTVGQLEDLGEAIQAAEKAIELTPVRSSNLPHRMNNLAALYQERYSRLGDLTDLQKAVSIYRRVVAEASPQDTRYPAYLINLGGCLHDLYRRNKNLEDLQSAIETLRNAVEAVPEYSPHRAGFLNTLGNALVTHYQKNEDLNALEEAITAQRGAVEMASGSPLQASFLTSLGSSLVEHYLYSRKADHLGEAVLVCETAISLTHSNSPKLASRWNNLARCLMERYKAFSQPEDLERGKDAYLKACQKGAILQTETALIAGYNWGEWALQRNAWQEATQALEYAIKASKELFQCQVLRSEREVWLREAQVLPAMAAYAQAMCGELKKAVMSLESGRTRILAETLRFNATAIESLRKEGHTELYTRYQRAVEQLRRLEASDSGMETPDNGTDYQDVARDERQELLRVIEAIQKIPGFEHLFREIEWIDIEPIFSRSDLEAVVYIAITSIGGLGLVISKVDIEPVWFDITAADLDRLMLGDTDVPEEGYVGAILGYIPVKDILGDMLHYLGERVIQPIAELLQRQKIEQVCLIPTGLLSLFPLHACSYRLNGKIHRWLEDFMTVYIPSIQSLQHCLNLLGRISKESRSFLGIANPAPLPNGVPTLTYAASEVSASGSVFPNSPIIIMGEVALFENVVGSFPFSSHIHFACHATFDANNPVDSGLILSKGKRLRIQDLISKSKFSKVRLAVLSACQTAITDFTKLPEEAIGLPAAFLQTGVPGIIGTLWPVNDLSTALLMVRFYQYHIGVLNDGKVPMSPARALREAQLWLRDLDRNQIDKFIEEYLPELTGRARLRRDEIFTHPYYWAGFTFNGL